MRVPRSSLMALAALLTGSVASAALAAETAALDTSATAPISAMPTPVAPTPTAPPDPAPSPAPTALPDYKPEAPAAEPAPAAAAPVAPTDPLGAAVFARLADPAPLLLRLTTKDRDAIRAFYEARADKPLWIADGTWTEAAKAVSARLTAAAEDGLDARAYTIPTLAEKPDEKAVADADLRLSAAAVLYARDARGGRVNLASISRLITPHLDLPAGNDVLAKLGDAGVKAGDVLQAYNPATTGYLALKARLAALRGPAPTAVKPLRLPSGRLCASACTMPACRCCARTSIWKTARPEPSIRPPASRTPTIPSSLMPSASSSVAGGCPPPAS